MIDKPGFIIELDDKKLRFCLDLRAMSLFQKVRGKKLGAVFTPFIRAGGKSIAAIKSAIDGEEDAQGLEALAAFIEGLDAEDWEALWWVGLNRYQNDLPIDQAAHLIHPGNFIDVIPQMWVALKSFFHQASQKEVIQQMLEKLKEKTTSSTSSEPRPSQGLTSVSDPPISGG